MYVLSLSLSLPLPSSKLLSLHHLVVVLEEIPDSLPHTHPTVVTTQALKEKEEESLFL